MVIIYPVLAAALVIGLAAAVRPDPSSKDQFAELYTSENRTELYDVTADKDADLVDNRNAITGESEDWREQEHSNFLKLRLRGSSNSFRNKTNVEKGVPMLADDAPEYVFDPEDVNVVRREKRDTAWQRAWRERYERYHQRQAPEQVRVAKRTAKRTTTTTTTTEASEVASNKFARQFVPSDAEDSSITLGDSEDDNTIAEQVETTTVRQTRRRNRQKPKKHAKSTTTTTEDPSEADDTAAVVGNLIVDLGRKKRFKSDSPEDLPPVFEIRPLWMEKEPVLDPRVSKLLQDIIVQKHNYLRSEVSPPAADMLQMEWSEPAQKIAQRWAEVCKFEHDSNDVRITSQFKCGQNLARGWPKPLSWNLTMQLWFDERKDFVYDGLPRGMVGHYTQLVWAQSYQVGCAYKDCGSFHYYVCNYCPTGNFVSKEYKPYKKANNFCESCPNDCNGKLCTNPCPYMDKFANCAALEQEFQVCSDASYGLQDSCKATCQCQGKIH